MVREEESAIGSGRNEASVKAFATQSDGCTSPPNTHTLKIGCRSQNPEAGCRLSRFPSGVTHHVFKAYFGASPLLEGSSVGRPHVLEHLLGQEWRFRWHSLASPLLAAFGTITAMFKCFKSMKIDIIRR